MLKMKGWDDFKKGKFNGYKRTSRMRAKYDIVLDKNIKEKRFIKVFYLEILNLLINIKKKTVKKKKMLF